jgi:membrane fusion protein (multidrug efflux system)
LLKANKRKEGKTDMIKRNRIMTLFIVLLLSMIFAAACKNKQTEEMTQMTTEGSGTTAIPVKAVQASHGSISSYIETTTSLEAEREVDIVCRTNGLVNAILVEEGDNVKTGSLLLKIDDREAKAAYQSSLATYEERKRQWERAQETFEKNIVSKESHDQARFNFAKSEADFEASKLQLAYTEIRAPFDGIITKRLVNSGSMLTPGQKIFTIVDVVPLLARIYLPEREIAKVKVGQTADLKLDALPGQSFKAKIKMINPVVDPGSGTFKVTLEVSAGNNILRPGMFASVYLITETHQDALLIPKQALLLEAEKDTVFIVAGRFAYTQEIKIGFRDDKNIEILDGIKDGEYVIVVGQDGLNNGSEVKLFDLQGKEIVIQEKKKKAAVKEDEDEQ